MKKVLLTIGCVWRIGILGKLLLPLGLLAVLSATTLAVDVHFFRPGDSDPTTHLSINLGQGPLNLGLHCDTQGLLIGGGTVDCSASWPGLLPLENVVFEPAWAGFSAFDGNALFSLFSPELTGPGDVPLATFDVPTQNLALGNYALTASGGSPGTLITDPYGTPLPTTTTDLIISVVPEPATIALLGLGGLALLRRRKA